MEQKCHNDGQKNTMWSTEEWFRKSKEKTRHTFASSFISTTAVPGAASTWSAKEKYYLVYYTPCTTIGGFD
jgi:hypothetical protein